MDVEYVFVSISEERAVTKWYESNLVTVCLDGFLARVKDLWDRLKSIWDY